MRRYDVVLVVMDQIGHIEPIDNREAFGYDTIRQAARAGYEPIYSWPCQDTNFIGVVFKREMDPEEFGL